MTLGVLLRLCRVSNLPTVITNVMAGMVLAGGQPEFIDVALVGLAACLLYVGGMALNDAFDAQIDARERPDRPIPAGEIGRQTVFAIGFALLGSGAAAMALHSGLRSPAFGAAAATAVLVVVYNAWHKGNPVAPAIMGMCRVGVYAMAALAVGSFGSGVWIGAALLLGYVIGLTYVAQFEASKGSIGRWWPVLGLLGPALYIVPALGQSGLLIAIWGAFGLWVYRAIRLVRVGGPSIGKAVGSLIAGIALCDALVLAREGATLLAIAAVTLFGATLALHRRVAGT